MANALQLRRGTTTQHSTFTGLAGEVTVDTTKDTVVVHDGATAGGIPLATESYVGTQVSTEVANLVDSAPSTLDTLNELAAALGDDPNFSTTVTNNIATKMPLSGGTFTGNVTLVDNAELRLGTSSDLKLFHNGINSYISDGGTGNLIIQSNWVKILNPAGTETMASFVQNGASTLYYDNSYRLATSPSGATVTGNSANSEAILRIDTNSNDKGDYRIRVEDGASFGTMYIEDFAGASWTKNLGVQSNGEVYFYEDGGNAVKYYWDSVNETTLHKDNVKAVFGDSADLEIFHDGSNSNIRDVGTGFLGLDTNGSDIRLTSGTNAKVMGYFAKDGEVILYHDGSGKITTTSTGADVTGTLTTDGVTVDGTLEINEVFEKVHTGASTSGTLDVNTNAHAIVYLTGNQTANRTINFSNVNSNLDIGQSLTATVLSTQGSTAYYFNAYQVDGTAVTPKWSGGSAPTAGNASGIDVYTFTIIKTANATFTVLASLTQYA